MYTHHLDHHLWIHCYKALKKRSVSPFHTFLLLLLFNLVSNLVCVLSRCTSWPEKTALGGVCCSLKHVSHVYCRVGFKVVKNASHSPAIAIKGKGLYDALTYSKDTQALRHAHSCQVDFHRTVWSLPISCFIYHAQADWLCCALVFLSTLFTGCRTADHHHLRISTTTCVCCFNLGFLHLKANTSYIRSSVCPVILLYTSVFL